MTSIEQRRDLGAFLASRRARCDPKEFGLPTGNRRTPGLRREEVAVLAGVSVSWYTWLEQGRDIRASADTLRRIAKVLRLDRVEAAHLLALSVPGVLFAEKSERPSDGLVMLVQAVDPIPAYVRNARFDILAWNAAAADQFVDYDTLPPFQRNTLWLLFLHPPYRNLIVNWETLARRYVAAFRAARVRAGDKAHFDELVTQLTEGSREFREWWSGVDVDVFDEGTKRLRHHSLGLVEYTYVTLTSAGQPELTMVSYVLRSAAYESCS
ncbi:helix-turn-helix transcriptional regulator [Methylobacterium oryzae]|uniref:helix-turn-helix transcriptional regulator n=1 Tax=Methylobacterium oryzae TaxID=334852 RepID=UPI000FDD4562|nr:helix-turn-helix transcriptional regulator [Methylobacterium oryzae]UIN35036.1 helix-turn-helix transcriptional regulator [Methylobacterium oryzae]